MHIICIKENIIMPKILQKCVVKWYHMYLLYPLIDCTDTTIIRQH